MEEARQIKKYTVNQCLEELERVAKIVCYEKVNENELDFFKKTMQGALEKLALARAEARERKEKRLRERQARKYTRCYNKEA